MVKLIVFDLDGVLVDARELHYQALNMALKDIDDSFVIERDEHLSTYDGLSTTKKLQMLSERKGLPEKFHHTVWIFVHAHSVLIESVDSEPIGGGSRR